MYSLEELKKLNPSYNTDFVNNSPEHAFAFLEMLGIEFSQRTKEAINELYNQSRDINSVNRGVYATTFGNKVRSIWNTLNKSA